MREGPLSEGPLGDPRPPTPRSRAWVEVDGGAIRRNLELVRSHVGSGARVVPIVKCDGYGLGAGLVVEALAPARPFAYGVATADEGRALRALGVREPVMVLCPAPPDDLPHMARARLVPTISELESLGVLANAASHANATAPLPFQLEIDTGMGRSGFALPDAAQWWPEVRRAVASPGLRLLGLFTHLHSADKADLGSARRQVERFDDFVASVEGIPSDALLHVANSAAALRLDLGAANAVRPGIFLYGGSVGHGALTPETVAALRARVVMVREAAPGATVGYGATYRARGRERWATVAIGYGDGLPRELGNAGRALLRGRRSPIVGRISMDTTVVRVAGEVAVGDPVTFLGGDGGAEVALAEVAEVADTVAHQVLTGLSARLPRIPMEQCR